MNAVSALILKAAKAAYNADRANVYINPTQFDYDIKIRTPAYNGRIWRFDPQADNATTRVALKPYGSKDQHGITICDGATGAPDWPTGVKDSAGLHDPGYMELDAIALAWKDEPFNPGPNLQRNWFMAKSPTWTHEDVRLLMDAMFGDSIRKLGGSSIVHRTYYTSVRYMGGVFRALSSRGFIPNKLPLALIASSLIAGAGCSGCLKAPDIIHTPYTGPDIQRVATPPSTTNTPPAIQ